MSFQKWFSKKTSAKAQEFVAQQEKRYRSELFAVGCCLVMIMGALALVSYNPNDPTLIHASSTAQVVQNWCGALGANTAAFHFFLFGAAAYLFLLITLLPLHVIFLGSIHAPLRRLGALFASVFLGSIVCAMYQLDPWLTGAGGNIGMAMHAVLARLVGVQGSQLLVWGLLWMSVGVALRVPLFAFVARSIKSMWWWVSEWFMKARDALLSLRVFARKSKKSEQAEWVAAPVRTVGVDVMGDVQPEPMVEESGVGGSKASAKLDLGSIAARTSSKTMRVLKWQFFYLPNSIIKKNMFASVGKKPSIAEKITSAVSALTEQFKLPGGTQFNTPPAAQANDVVTDRATQQARKVEEKLNHFGVKGKIVDIKQGPVVTLFEYKPEIDSKVSKIVGLEDDLTMALTAHSMRVIAPLPGKNAVGFEIANTVRGDVLLSSLLESEAFAQSKAALPVVLGVDTVGTPVVEDLTKMPHLLVGGSTGSGKSVGLNTMLVSLLCKRTPDEMSLILIDPKRLEFTPYANIPHLVFPIVTQPAMATRVLGWVVTEMERRYQRMAEMGIRTFKPSLDMKYLVVIIDELADLMMVAGKDVEAHLVRLAQMARAAGIHLIVATQRPSVDVVTGLIKVNFPSRIAFRVSSKVDSRTILDAPGAERLLGRGDMLYMHAASTELRRVHGAYVADAEIERVADFVRAQRAAEYLDIQEVLERSALATREEIQDTLYPEVVKLIQTADEISISMIQRHYRIGFNRSARLIEKLELDGYLAPAQGAKPRKVIR